MFCMLISGPLLEQAAVGSAKGVSASPGEQDSAVTVDGKGNKGKRRSRKKAKEEASARAAGGSERIGTAAASAAGDASVAAAASPTPLARAAADAIRSAEDKRLVDDPPSAAQPSPLLPLPSPSPRDQAADGAAGSGSSAAAAEPGLACVHSSVADASAAAASPLPLAGRSRPPAGSGSGLEGISGPSVVIEDPSPGASGRRPSLGTGYHPISADARHPARIPLASERPIAAAVGAEVSSAAAAEDDRALNEALALLQMAEFPELPPPPLPSPAPTHRPLPPAAAWIPAAETVGTQLSCSFLRAAGSASALPVTAPARPAVPLTAVAPAVGSPARFPTAGSSAIRGGSGLAHQGTIGLGAGGGVLGHGPEGANLAAADVPPPGAVLSTEVEETFTCPISHVSTS